MNKIWQKRAIALILSATMISQQTPADRMLTSAATTDTDTVTDSTSITSFEPEALLNLEKTAGTVIGTQTSAGGLAGSIVYNSDNHKAYQVNGSKGILNILPMEKEGSFGETVEIDVKTLIEDFTYGNATSVAVDTVNDYIAVTLEASDYRLNGQVILLDYDGNLLQHYETGVQPNMVTFTKDGKKMLTSNEGEPRKGYGSGTTDPAGSVTIIDLSKETDAATTVGFDAFDSTTLSEEYCILFNKVSGKILSAAADLEPESIAVNDAGTKAYVCLQDANAIATLDLTTNTFTEIQSLGFTDHADSANAIDLISDGGYEPNTYENVYGVPMPHSISTYEIDGATYIVTANEGNVRKYNTFTNEKSTTTLTAVETLINEDTGDETAITAKNVHTLNPTYTAGLLEGTEEDGSDTPVYLFGSRSFSIYDAESMSLVYDSGCAFEEKIAEHLPANFNCTNISNKVDGASAVRGPEPKDITIGTIDSRTYAFISLEGVGGIIVYDITDPNSPEYINYINSRDFTSTIKGDVSPNGLTFITANHSNNELPMILAAFDVSGTVAGYSITGEAAQEAMILYTNDVHCSVEGYPNLAAYREQMIEAGYRTILADAGDAIQGEPIGTLTKGSALVDLMNQTGYELAVPGIHEFDYGMDTFLDLAQNKANYSYISSNFSNLQTNSSVFEGYQFKNVGGNKIAFVGISSPDAYAKTTLAYFKNENGELIYDFSQGDDFYKTIQTNIDNAIADGADYVIAIGHTGVDGSTGWKSTDIIENTTGINVYLDALSHEVIEGDIYENKNNEDVILCSTGSKFENIGKLIIDANGEITTEFIDTTSVEHETTTRVNMAYDKLQASVNSYNNQINTELTQQIGTSETDLIGASEDSDGSLLYTQETNMGDFAADAYKTVSGAEIAFASADKICASLEKGTITREALMEINPNDNDICVIKATGQQIIDALEYGVRNYPEESDHFLQVSGLTYEINSSVTESPVIVDEDDLFVSIDSELRRRVQKVTVGNNAIDLTKTYTLAANVYTLLDSNSGFTMFANNEVIRQTDLPKDSEMLIQYVINNLNGTITSKQYGEENGDGRIQIVEDLPDPDDNPIVQPGKDPDDNTGSQTGNHSGNDSNNDSDNNSNNAPTTPTTPIKKPANTVTNTKITVKRAVISSLKVSGKKLKVKIKKLSGVKGYQIKYSTSKKFTKKTTKTVNTKKTSVTLKKLKKGKKYYVKVKAYKLNAKKEKVYGKFSKVKSKKIKK